MFACSSCYVNMRVTCIFLLKMENDGNFYMLLEPNKTIPLFRVTRSYLNLLVKPINFFRLSGKNIILCNLKGEMPFKMQKIIFFQKNKLLKKCVPTLPKIFRPVT